MSSGVTFSIITFTNISEGGIPAGGTSCRALVTLAGLMFIFVVGSSWGCNSFSNRAWCSLPIQPRHWTVREDPSGVSHVAWDLGDLLPPADPSPYAVSGGYPSWAPWVEDREDPKRLTILGDERSKYPWARCSDESKLFSSTTSRTKKNVI